MIALTSILSDILLMDTPDVEESVFKELGSASINDSIANGSCIVLFYSHESGVCKKMEYNLNQIVDDIDSKTRLYKINLDNNSAACHKFGITGSPTTFIFKDGKVLEMIMGIVPVSNLELICKRLDFGIKDAGKINIQN